MRLSYFPPPSHALKFSLLSPHLVSTLLSLSFTSYSFIHLFSLYLDSSYLHTRYFISSFLLSFLASTPFLFFSLALSPFFHLYIFFHLQQKAYTGGQEEQNMRPQQRQTSNIPFGGESKDAI